MQLTKNKTWKVFQDLADFFLQTGLTALHLAAKEGHHEIIKALLDRGASPNQASKVMDHYYLMLRTYILLFVVLVCLPSGGERKSLLKYAPPIVKLVLEKASDFL